MGPPWGDVGWGWMNVLVYGLSGSRVFISGMKWISRLELASSLKFGKGCHRYSVCDTLHRAVRYLIQVGVIRFDIVCI